MSTKQKKIIYRSSVTGRFITEKYAKDHPATTEKQHVAVGKPRPKK